MTQIEKNTDKHIPGASIIYYNQQEFKKERKLQNNTELYFLSEYRHKNPQQDSCKQYGQLLKILYIVTMLASSQVCKDGSRYNVNRAQHVAHAGNPS